MSAASSVGARRDMHVAAGGTRVPLVLVIVLGVLAVTGATWLMAAGTICGQAESGATTSSSTHIERAPASSDLIGDPAPDSTSPRPPAPRATTQAGEHDGTVCVRDEGWAPAATAGLGALLVAGTAAAVASYASVRRRSHGEPSEADNAREHVRAGVSPGDVSPLPRVDPDERRRLIDALIYAIDRLGGNAVAARLKEALIGVGVQQVGSPGERFDATKHHAVAAVPAPGADQDGIVADVDEVGYLDGDALVRPAQVTVYRCGP